MADEVCTRSVRWGEVLESCEPDPEADKADEEKGNFWGELACAFRSSNYTQGCKYDKKNDRCECRGDFRPPLWRR